MEAWAGCRCGADGRKGIHTESISDESGGAGRRGWGGRGAGLSSIDMYNNDVGQESAQKFMK